MKRREVDVKQRGTGRRIQKKRDWSREERKNETKKTRKKNETEELGIDSRGKTEEIT